MGDIASSLPRRESSLGFPGAITPLRHTRSKKAREIMKYPNLGKSHMA
jgi:hypothetical protein